jgi:3D (Asp-Asp-Asp) domain-containing protein
VEKSLFLLVLVVFVSCGKTDTKQGSLPPERETPPIVIDPADLQTILPLKPTMYYLPHEKNISCIGKYSSSGPIYDGSEKSGIMDRDNKKIATVCTRFFRVLNMEGSAILKDRGQGDFVVNYAGVVNGDRRFRKVERCIYGEGVSKNLCLLPHHTLATDNKIHKIGEIVYIPKAEGLILPDGSVHEGFFIVRDTGGAFEGVGHQRVDIFTGLEPDLNNTFSRAGFNHQTEFEAFKVTGDSAENIKTRLQDKFGELY